MGKLQKDLRFVLSLQQDVRPEFAVLFLALNPNPPMDGARIAEGGEEVTDATVRTRIRVDWRLEGGLPALLGAPMAAYNGFGERDGGIGHGKTHSWTGLARVGGEVESVAEVHRQDGRGSARNRARARLNWFPKASAGADAK